MIYCKKCKGRIFIDRVECSVDHLEVYCIICGLRKIYRPPSRFGSSVQWLHATELNRMKKYNGL